MWKSLSTIQKMEVLLKNWFSNFIYEEPFNEYKEEWIFNFSMCADDIRSDTFEWIIEKAYKMLKKEDLI